MPTLRHKLIAASAGSGKTYQLVRRYLHLLACGEQPSRITAVTFTRKAAGEFVNRILRSLSDLAEDDAKADAFVRELTPPPEHPADFKRVLKEVIRDLPRLRLGTIDSFFATVAACFPLELGQPVGATVMSEEEAKRAKSQVITQLLARLYREHDRNAARLLLEAFKQATFGNEEKKVLDTLNDWLGEGHDLWHECEDATRWGQPEAIWPRAQHGDAAIWNAMPTVSEALDAFIAAFDASTLKHKSAVTAWQNIQEQAATLRLGQSPPTSLATLLTKLAEIRAGLKAGDGKMKYYCEWAFQGRAAEAVLNFLLTVVGRELHTRCQRTQGIRSVIDAYESDYANTVRSRGRLSFADLARLLARTQGDGSWADDESRADLWYRMDGRVDHWLFDEFQDTSAQQWSIMRSLVDEVLQDPEGHRSFFAVGDVKQSIYLWRKAEPQLFDHVLNAYQDNGKHGIVPDTLAKSWRSSSQVLDFVNGVFSDEALLREMLGDACLKHWKFTPHTAARDLQGVGALVQPQQAQGEEEQNDEMAVCAALLRQLQPTRRQLSCAVLVRSNKAATTMTEYLREHTDLEVMSQSEEHPAEDNPATAAILAALQLAAHPGDRFALEHLRMTPLAPLFITDDDWRAQVNATLEAVQADGFASAVELWAERVLAACGDAFTNRRVEKLSDIAAEFDDTGSRNIDEFIEFARGYGVRTGGTLSAVQVMTVHKSKGLEFDIVLVPVSENKSLANADASGLIVKRDGLAPADWVLQFPTKPYVELDPVLAAQKQAMDDEAGFEALCRLYVAMTRAQRALYVVVPRPPKKDDTINASHLLRATLGTDAIDEVIEDVGVEWLRVFGDTQWFESIPVKDAKPEVAPLCVGEVLGALLKRHQPMPKRRTPSGEEAFTVKGSVLFSLGRETGRNLGTLVHQMMEQVAWIDEDFDEATIVARWQALRLDQQPAFDRAQEQVLAVLRSMTCRDAFTKPGSHTKLWRERPFDLVQDDGEWITGTIDRVNIACDASGKALSATIIDFKTDDVRDEAMMQEKLAGYAPQIALYRLAVSRLTGLPADKIEAKLLFTRAGRCLSDRESER